MGFPVWMLPSPGDATSSQRRSVTGSMPATTSSPVSATSCSPTSTYPLSTASMSSY
jgi:hypothetical protein